MNGGISPNFTKPLPDISHVRDLARRLNLARTGALEGRHGRRLLAIHVVGRVRTAPQRPGQNLERGEFSPRHRRW